MLLEIAIADAYGAGFEFTPIEFVNQFNDLSAYHTHGLGFTAKYTDDTQMSIAIAELIIDKTSWTPLDIANKFVTCFKRDPRLGYSKGFQQLLTSVDDGAALLNTIRPISTRNGSAMRSVPLGVIQDIDVLMFAAEQQAKVSHHTALGIQASQSVALAAHIGLYNKGKLHDLPAILVSHHLPQWRTDWSGYVSVNADETLHAVFTCLLRNTTLSELLKDAISFSGDTDSIAAIAVGIATCFPNEYLNNLPQHLYDTLDEREYGLAFLKNLDRTLLDT